MRFENSARLIALDWGTTKLRAYLLGSDGAILASRESADGVAALVSRQSTDHPSPALFRDAYENLCMEWLARQPPLPVIASGMVGSRQGWREAAYLECPAGLAQLSHRLLRIDDLAGRPFAIVPGLMQTEPADRADVMRGEETQLLGLLGQIDSPRSSIAGANHADSTLFVLPGTHSKWVQVRQAQVISFATFMTGELYAAIADHTIVGRLMPANADHFDQPTFCAALAQGTDEAEQLTALLFSIRAQGLLGRLPLLHLASRLSGLLIGAELAGAQRRFGAFTEVHLVGSSLLTERYRIALAERGKAAVRHEADIAAAGLYSIAKQARLLAVS